MKRWERRRIDEIKTPKVGEQGRRPKQGRLPKFGFPLTLDRITPLMGGRDPFMELARHCENEKVRELVAMWDSLPKREKNRCQLEPLCAGVGLEPAKLLGDVVASAWVHGVDAIKLITAIGQPLVLEKIVERALEDDGHRERRMFLEATGLLGSRAAGLSIFESSNKGPESRETEPPDFPRIEEENIRDPQFGLVGDD